MRQCMIDLKRGIVSLKFPAAVTLCAMVYWLGSLGEIGAVDIPYILDASVSFSGFYHLFPIVAVLPLGASFLNDLQSGNLRFVFQRVEANRYLARRFLVAGVVGGLATALGMLLFLGVLLPLAHPLATLNDAETEAIYPYAQSLIENRQWFLYFGLYALLQWASGFMWGGIGLMFSAVAGRMQLTYLATVLFMEVLCRGLFSVGKNHIILYAAGILEAETIGQLLGEAILLFALLSFFAFLIFMVSARRRLRYV